MAVLTSLSGLNFATANLAFYGDSFSEEGYLEDAFIDLNGTTYDDFYFVRATTQEVDLVLIVLGRNFTIGTDGFIESGFVEAIAEAEWDGNDRWYVEDLALDLLSVLDVIYGDEPTAQENLFFDAFFGDDLFDLSSFADDGVEGYFGNDTFKGGSGGFDTMFGGPGDDLFEVSIGDYVDGGEGFDTVSFALTRSVEVTLGNNAENSGDATGSTFNSVESLIGSLFDDRFATTLLVGVMMDGDAGADSLTGGDGDDSLVGGDGSDSIEGGAGDDFLIGDSAASIEAFTQFDFDI